MGFHVHVRKLTSITISCWNWEFSTVIEGRKNLIVPKCNSFDEGSISTVWIKHCCALCIGFHGFPMTVSSTKSISNKLKDLSIKLFERPGCWNLAARSPFPSLSWFAASRARILVQVLLNLQLLASGVPLKAMTAVQAGFMGKVRLWWEVEVQSKSCKFSKIMQVVDPYHIWPQGFVNHMFVTNLG